MSKNDLEKMNKYIDKQKIVGKVFDFNVSQLDGSISIKEYYDMPNRKSIIIPDFVTCSGGLCPFGRAENLEKIIYKGNDFNNIDELFRGVSGGLIDLSEFNTKQIESACNTFYFNRIDKLIINDELESLKYASGCFQQSDIKEIQINKYPTLSKLQLANRMFENTNLDLSKLLNSMTLKSLQDGSYMFKEDNFNIENLTGKFNSRYRFECTGMFFGIKFKKMIFGEDFNLENMISPRCIFDSAEGEELYLPNSFNECLNYTNRNKILGDVRNIKCIHIGDEEVYKRTSQIITCDYNK